MRVGRAEGDAFPRRSFPRVETEGVDEAVWKSILRRRFFLFPFQIKKNNNFIFRCFLFHAALFQLFRLIYRRRFVRERERERSFRLSAQSAADINNNDDDDDGNDDDDDTDHPVYCRPPLCGRDSSLRTDSSRQVRRGGFCYETGLKMAL